MKKHISTFVSAIVILAAFAFVVFKSFDFKSNAQSESSTTQLPPIISKIKSLEIVNVKISNAGSRDESAGIDLKNNSSKPIVAISIESGDEIDSSGIITSGFGKEPSQIIALPFEILTMDFPLANVVRGLPIRISGVMYADGSVDGEEKAANNIRADKVKMDNRRKGETE